MAGFFALFLFISLTFSSIFLQKQLRDESSYLLEKWGDELFSDPAYNKNLTLLKEDFSLGFDRVNDDLCLQKT